MKRRDQDRLMLICAIIGVLFVAAAWLNRKLKRERAEQEAGERLVDDILKDRDSR